jgi:hypothetical protein
LEIFFQLVECEIEYFEKAVIPIDFGNSDLIHAVARASVGHIVTGARVEINIRRTWIVPCKPKLVLVPRLGGLHGKMHLPSGEDY